MFSVLYTDLKQFIEKFVKLDPEARKILIVENLFTLANDCVARNLFAERDELYNCIRIDQRSTTDQLNIVNINDGMILRRNGRFDDALETLEPLTWMFHQSP